MIGPEGSLFGLPFGMIVAGADRRRRLIANGS